MYVYIYIPSLVVSLHNEILQTRLHYPDKPDSLETLSAQKYTLLVNAMLPWVQ